MKTKNQQLLATLSSLGLMYFALQFDQSYFGISGDIVSGILMGMGIGLQLVNLSSISKKSKNLQV